MKFLVVRNFQSPILFNLMLESNKKNQMQICKNELFITTNGFNGKLLCMFCFNSQLIINKVKETPQRFQIIQDSIHQCFLIMSKSCLLSFIPKSEATSQIEL